MAGTIIADAIEHSDSTSLATNQLVAKNATQTFTASQRGEITTLTSGSTVTPDFAASNNFTLTLGENLTIANPTNLVAGQSGSIFLVQDGTGSRTITWGSYFDWAGGTAPTFVAHESTTIRSAHQSKTHSPGRSAITREIDQIPPALWATCGLGAPSFQQYFNPSPKIPREGL